MTPTPDCVVCRRQVCADYRTCAGELARLCARVSERFERRHDDVRCGRRVR